MTYAYPCLHEQMYGIKDNSIKTAMVISTMGSNVTCFKTFYLHNGKSEAEGTRAL